MKKLIIAYLFTITNIFAAPPTYFNGELQTNTYIQNIKAPNYQTTPLGGIDRRLETGNLNELQNPSFEHVTVTTGWTISNATSSSSTTRIEGSKSLSLALTGALSLSQSSTINAAQKSGIQMVASIWVNSSDVSDLKLCSLKNGVEDKCTVTGGYVQGSGWRQLTVSFLGDTTSNGLKLKSTDTTGTVLVDQAYVGIGSPIVDFTPDMVYSAKISSTGVVSDENTDFIQGDCTLSGTANNRKTCTFKTSVFTVSPNCVVVANSPTCEGGGCGEYQTPVSVSASQIILAGLKNSDIAYSASSLQLICQKQGADYKTSKAYVASSSDTDWSSCGHTTSDFTGFGTVSAINLQCKRKGGDLKIKGSFIFGSPSSVEARINLKFNGLPVSASSSISGTQIAGYSSRNVANNGASIYTNLITANSGYFTLSFANNAIANPLISQQGSTLIVSGDAYVISNELSIPIQGWTDSGVIVGSFQGYNETPGTSRVETFSVSYGTTNATTICSASPCSYLDQIGNAVTSITRSTTGTYSLNTSKTYSKLKCTWAVGGATPQVAYSASGFGCANCSALSFKTLGTATTADADSWGTLVCQGIPQ